MKLSLVIPTVGRSPYLAEAINSALEQIEAFDEVVVFANGVDRAELPPLPARVRLECCPQRLPPHESWNRAVSVAAGPAVLILGDDDLLEPSMAVAARAALRESRFVALGYGIISENGQRVHQTQWSTATLSVGALYANLFGGGLALLLPGLVFLKIDFEQAGGFRPSPCTNGWFIDTDAWLRLAAVTGGLKLQAGCHWCYRVNRGQLGYATQSDSFAPQLEIYLSRHADMVSGLGLQPLPADVLRRQLLVARLVSSMRNGAFNGVPPRLQDLGRIWQMRRVVPSGSVLPLVREWCRLAVLSRTRWRAGR